MANAHITYHKTTGTVDITLSNGKTTTNQPASLGLALERMLLEDKIAFTVESVYVIDGQEIRINNTPAQA